MKLECELYVYEPKNESVKQYIKLNTPWQGLGFPDMNVEKICKCYHIDKLIPIQKMEDKNYVINKFSCNMRVY